MSGDIHNLEYSERMKFLNKLSNSKHIVKAETKIVGNESELRKAVKWASSQEGSEGSYLKRLDFPYELDGKTNLNIKYKNTFSIDVEVKDIHKVSGAESWNYLCTIKDGKRDVPIGRTYNTSIKLSEGDIVKVEFVNLNKYFDVKLKRGWYNWWSPRPIMARKDKKRPDNVDTADELVKASNGEIKNRRASIALDGDPYMMVPAEDKKILGMAHMHVRGKSVTDRTPIIVRDLETGDVSVIPIKDVFSPKELVKEKITEKEVDNLEVWTALGWSRILHAYRHRQDKPPIRLKCQEGLVEVTEDHSLFQNGVPVMTKALTVGESLDMADLPVLEGEEDVDKGLAWLYGFYLAEGNREKRGIGLTSGDMSLLERAQRIVSRLGFATNICVTHSQLKLNHSPCWKLEIGRLDISSFFETGGVHEVAERRARWKIVPVFVFSWNVESQRAFLEGYFDGDGIGIAYEKKKIEWASASQALAQGVLLIARRVFPEYPNYSIVWQDAVVRINLRQGTGNRLDSREEIKSIIPGRFHETKRGAKNPNYRGGQYVEKNAEKGVWYYSKQRWVYDIETESHDFIAGVGRVIAHNSVHIDLRFGVTKDWAVGWTLYIPKGLSKVPETFTEAKTLVDKEIMPIVKEKLKDPTQKFNCGTKAVEPIEWLDYQGRVEKGEVGATKNEPGYFYIIDRFDARLGAQKPHYHEYFCDGKIFNGRFCVRLLENKEEWKKTGEGLMTWMASTALTDKTPYVLGRRAITKKWVPPYGHSALPEKIRSKVPKEYQYWNSRDPKKRLEIRDSLIAEIKKTRISIDALGPVSYKVLKQTFKKQTVIREGPTRTRYFFVICKAGVQKLSLAFLNNPLEQDELTGIKTKLSVKLCGYKGHENQVKPGTELNKTKATPSNIEVLEEGKATALVDRAVKEYKLKEGKMKGNWITYNEEEGSAMWVLKRIIRVS